MSIISLDNNSTIRDISNYEKSIKKGKWIIRYHATWCGHCKHMIPEWGKFESLNKSVNIASVEYSIISKLSKKPKNLMGFPSVQLINNGKFIQDFKQERTAINFKNFYNLTMGDESKSKKKRKRNSKKKLAYNKKKINKSKKRRNK